MVEHQTYILRVKSSILLPTTKYSATGGTPTILKVLERYVKNRMATDPSFKLIRKLRSKFYKYLKRNQSSGSFVRDLGCSPQELKKHIEDKFYNHPQSGIAMSWHIDHIRPLCSFNLLNREDFIEAVNYKNLQPLWAEDNMKKRKQDLKEKLVKINF